jgi:hypothetical protein
MIFTKDDLETWLNSPRLAHILGNYCNYPMKAMNRTLMAVCEVI